MRLTPQALHCRIDAVEKACCRITKITNNVTKSKDSNVMECEEMGEHQPRRRNACTGSKNCLDGAMMLSKKDSWELHLIDDNLQVDSRQGRVIFKYPLGRDLSLLEKPVMDSTSPDKMLREPNIEEPAVDSASPDDILRMSTNYDERQRTTASQKDDVLDYDLELKDGKDSELSWVTKVMDPLKDSADAGDNGRVTAGCDLRVLATEAYLGSHIDPDAAATIKQE